jgi:Flp pilus assembly protein TadG
MRHLIRALCDRSGTVAIEFAFIFPLMITLFLGCFEASNAIIMYLKLVDAADTISDLVAQQLSVSSTMLTYYYDAGQLVMLPNSGGGLGLAVASVTFNTAGSPTTAWQVERGGAAAMTNLTSSNTTLTSLGDTTGSASVIVAQATYTYNSLFKYVIKTPIAMTATVYSRPRYISSVPCSSSPCN